MAGQKKRAHMCRHKSLTGKIKLRRSYYTPIICAGLQEENIL